MKKKKILFAVITAILTVIMSVAFTGCEKSVPFDFKEYVKIAFSGHDYYGEANLKTYKIENIPERFYADITCTLSKKEDLVNGDEITISFKWDKDYAKEHNISVKNSEFDVTVEGLEPTTIIDPFENLTLECKTEYISKDNSISDLRTNYINIPKINTDNCIDNKWSCEYYTKEHYELNSNIYPHTADPKYKKDYKNGDTVTMVAVMNKNENFYISNSIKTEDNKYIFEKDFTISGFDDFINDINNIPSDSIQDLKQKAFESVNSYSQNLAKNYIYFDEYSKQNVFSRLYGSDTKLENVTITNCDKVKFNSSYFVTGKNGSGRLYFVYDVSFTGSAKDVPSQRVDGVIAVYYGSLMVDSQNNVISKGFNDESGFKWNSPEKNLEDIKNTFMKTYGEIQPLEN